MTEPWEWREEDIQTLVREQRPEDLQLEYKRSDALDKTEKNKRKIAKDVSAMGNSAGGVLTYGIDEPRKSNGPILPEGGIDPKDLSREWLEQVIDSGVRRRIDGIRVHFVEIATTGKGVYVIWIPQSNQVPTWHQTTGITSASVRRRSDGRV
jgi:predicted HTH transcriptional regulator